MVQSPSVEQRFARFRTGIFKARRTWSYPIWLALPHVINHQTYHRGQITTLLRQLGIKPPAVDLLIPFDQHALDPDLFTDEPLQPRQLCEHAD
ncbi:MAG: hypothetical protein LAO56_12885 [Acidobacteriia bacterium]|nr:hypothetical protein [Terriglobia bacterium]